MKNFSKETIEADLKEDFNKGNVQLFVGSGLSYGLYPKPNRFRDILLDEDIYIERKLTSLRDFLGNHECSVLEDAAQFYEIYKKPHGIIKMLKKHYGGRKEPMKVHRSLWRLPGVKTIYTTNYDCLIEDALRYPMQEPSVITGSSDLRNVDQSGRIVFKPHGCARRSRIRDDFVITRNDYLNYSHSNTLSMIRSLYDVSTKTFLFLGYSLKDMNMRHVITEANRITRGGIKSYAVLDKISGPEGKYWESLNVTLIEIHASDFIDNVLRSFKIDITEFSQKVEQRVQAKQEIANKAIQKILSLEVGTEPINVIIDAGSTCYYFAEALMREINQENFPLENIRIFTNSPPVVKIVNDAMRIAKNTIPLYCVGGHLNYHTQAIISDQMQMNELIERFINEGDESNKTIAFLGTTSFGPEGFKTRGKEEVEIKKMYIEKAQHVCILADHSKHMALVQGHSFSELRPDKILIICDRKDDNMKWANDQII